MSKFAPLDEKFFSEPILFATCPHCSHNNVFSVSLPAIATCTHPTCREQFIPEEVDVQAEEDAIDAMCGSLNDYDDDWGY